MSSCTSLDQDGLGHHMTICIGDVLIHIDGLNRSVFFFFYLVMLYYVTISVYKFCVLGVQGPSCGLAAVLHSDYHGDERATTGGKYLNITSLGNKVRCRFSA